MRKACAALFLFCVSTLPVGAATQIVGKVVRIADGDTLTVLDSANRQHRVRLAAIDAPDMQVPSKKS